MDATPLQHELVGNRTEPPVQGFSVTLTAPWSPEDQIIEEFEFDLELVRKFKTSAECCTLAVNPVTLLLCLPCYIAGGCLNQNNADEAYGSWVGISHQNIFIVRKGRKTGLRCYCCDQGEVRKIIPIANVQDVMIVEPAGTAVCCFVPNVLPKSEVQTAAAGGATGPNSGEGGVGTLIGLRDPKRFRDRVMEIKRQQGHSAGIGMPMAAPAQMGMGSAVVERLLDVNEQILAELKALNGKLAKD